MIYNIDNPLLKFSGDIVKMLHKYLGFDGKPLPSCPLWSNPLFKAGKRVLKNKIWQQNNIQNLSQLIINGKSLVLFSELKKYYGLKETEFLNYLQIKSVLKSLLSQDIKLGDKKDLEDKFKQAVAKRGTVSKIYRLLCNTKLSISHVTKNQWIQDAGVPISAAQWNAAQRKCTNISKCVKYKILQLKIFHWSYITPYILNKINKDISKLCWHGCRAEGTLMHLLWRCPSVQTFWSTIINTLSHMFDVQITPCPLDCLLGKRTQDFKSKSLNNVISLGFLAAKRIIMMNWKKRNHNCFDVQNWIKDFLDLVSMEQAAQLLNHDCAANLNDPLSTVKSSLLKYTGTSYDVIN